MKSKIILLFFVFGSTFLSAQTINYDSLRLKYNNQTIYRYGSTFLKGSERLGFRDLSREFSMSDLGLAGYEKAKKYKTTATIFRFVSLAAGIAVAGIAANGNNRDLAWGLLGGQIVTSFVSVHYNHLSSESLDRALWQRNKDLLFPAR